MPAIESSSPPTLRHNIHPAQQPTCSIFGCRSTALSLLLHANGSKTALSRAARLQLGQPQQHSQQAKRDHLPNSRPHNITLTPMHDRWHTRIRLSTDGHKDINAWMLQTATTRDARTCLASIHSQWQDYRICTQSHDLQPDESLYGIARDSHDNGSILLHVIPRVRGGMRNSHGTEASTSNERARASAPTNQASHRRWLRTMPAAADSEPRPADSDGGILAGPGRRRTALATKGISDIANQLQKACSALHLCATYTINLLADASHQLEAADSLEEIADVVELIRLDEHGEDLWRTHCCEATYTERPPSKCRHTFLEAFAGEWPHDLATQFQGLMNSTQAAWRLRDYTVQNADQLAKMLQIASAADELDTWLHTGCHTWGDIGDQHTAAGRTLPAATTNLLDVITDTASEIRAHHGLLGPKCSLHSALQNINTIHRAAELLHGKTFDAFTAHSQVQQALQDEAGIRYIKAKLRDIFISTQLCNTAGRPTHSAAKA